MVLKNVLICLNGYLSKKSTVILRCVSKDMGILQVKNYRDKMLLLEKVTDLKKIKMFIDLV